MAATPLPSDSWARKDTEPKTGGKGNRRSGEPERSGGSDRLAAGLLRDILIRPNPGASREGADLTVVSDNGHMRVIGVDLAWGEGTSRRVANETGVLAVELDGTVVDAGWTCGLPETVEWIERRSSADTLMMVDAPLVVMNASGQRICETQVGQRYGRWKVSANSTNLNSPRLAGVSLREALATSEWQYTSGIGGLRPTGGRHLAEVYPYTTLVGAPELGYDRERPIYKRRPKSVPVGEFRALRAANCNELVRRLGSLVDADPPIDLRSNDVTAALLAERSPLEDKAYKHREDLIDAVLCAWTGLLWLAHGLTRCQVLGSDGPGMPPATIIAPAGDSESFRPPIPIDSGHPFR